MKKPVPKKRAFVVKKLKRRAPRNGAPAKGQRKALEALFKTYPINREDEDE